MNIETYRIYCLSKPGTNESMPFGDDALVIKVLDKVFTILGLDERRANLKCDPEWAIELREQNEDITPGYHMNKKHWNTVQLEGNLDDKFIFKMIDHSYDLVYDKLTRKQKELLSRKGD